MTKKRNKVDKVSFIGGFIGWLMVDPRTTIDNRVTLANGAGWNLVQLTPTGGSNALIAALRFVVLILTLGLLTFGDGVYLIFEKEVE